MRRAWLVLGLAMCLAGVGCEGEPPPPPPLPQAPVDYGHTPVLFLHGSGVDADWTWPTMIAAFERAGYPRSYLLAIDMTPSTGSSARAARSFVVPAVVALLDQASRAAEQAGRPECRPRKVDLVAHSMGAVAARYYVGQIAPERVRSLVSLAGANHGSDALCGMAGDGNREMCPAFARSDEASALQVLLNGTPEVPKDETPYGLGADAAGRVHVPPDEERRVAYFAAWLDEDEWIEPERSARLDGTGGVEAELDPRVAVRELVPGGYLLESGVEHGPLPHDPHAIALVLALLEARDHQVEAQASEASARVCTAEEAGQR